MDPSRRRLIGVLGSVTTLIGARALAAGQTSGAPAKRVSETEPLAQSLGYKDDASKVDKSKFPTFKPGEKCAKCTFFQGDPGKPTGPCQIFSGKLVSSNGWCASFNAKH